ncbi:MAG: hypothetical protein JWN89_688 [Parcubacteria group bacterium]|nr:hypothetical protein [Parcubacteria group bacterium]
MKKIYFLIICAISISLMAWLLKFIGGWFVWYLLIVPLVLRFFLKLVFQKLFPGYSKINILFNSLTALAYILVIFLIFYIVGHSFGNSWI